jgi:hypothetical protein
MNAMKLRAFRRSDPEAEKNAKIDAFFADIYTDNVHLIIY